MLNPPSERRVPACAHFVLAMFVPLFLIVLLLLNNDYVLNVKACAFVAYDGAIS